MRDLREEGAQVAYLALAGGLNPIPAEAVKEIKESIEGPRGLGASAYHHFARF